jgi:hypothetical protein
VTSPVSHCWFAALYERPIANRMDGRDVEPVRGCTKVSPGCQFFYAETFAERFRGVPGLPVCFEFWSALRDQRLAGPVREQPHRVLGERALVTAHASAPDGAAPFAATRALADLATRKLDWQSLMGSRE